jgi:hypothetical protein
MNFGNAGFARFVISEGIEISELRRIPLEHAQA